MLTSFNSRIFTAILSARSGKTAPADTNLAEFKQVISRLTTS